MTEETFHCDSIMGDTDDGDRAFDNNGCKKPSLGPLHICVG